MFASGAAPEFGMQPACNVMLADAEGVLQRDLIWARVRIVRHGVGGRVLGLGRDFRGVTEHAFLVAIRI